MMLYEFVSFKRFAKLSTSEAAEMFGIAPRTVRELVQKVRDGKKDYELKKVDGSKSIKFLRWKLARVNAKIQKMQEQMRLDAIREAQEIIARYKFNVKDVVVKKRGRPAKKVDTTVTKNIAVGDTTHNPIGLPEGQWIINGRVAVNAMTCR